MSEQMSGSSVQCATSPGGGEVKGMPLTAVFLWKQGSVSPSATKSLSWVRLTSVGACWPLPFSLQTLKQGWPGAGTRGPKPCGRVCQGGIPVTRYRFEGPGHSLLMLNQRCAYRSCGICPVLRPQTLSKLPQTRPQGQKG